MAGKPSMDNIEKQIKILDDKIEKAEEYTNKLKNQRQELIDKRETLKMQEVVQILRKSNMTADQAIAILTSYNKENHNENNEQNDNNENNN